MLLLDDESSISCTPKGCFKGEQDIHPGKIVEYDATLMTSPPTPLSFDKAMQGWEFLNYFKSTIESATGIFKKYGRESSSSSKNCN